MPSQWRARPAGERAAIERFDHHAGLRNALREIGQQRGDWAGIPMPLEGESLVVEPTYPNAEALMAMCGEKDDEKIDSGPPLPVRGSFWSHKLRSQVVTLTDGARVTFGVVPGVHNLKMALHTLGCSGAWGIEQESNAVHTLAELVSHRQFKHYMLTGAFLETSKRSGVLYMFRRLRPTVAINMKDRGRGATIMCALCLHPIAYYAGSWAGAMCPTDDVIAHLMLMRGDEPMFWRRSNQHPPHRPEAGL